MHDLLFHDARINKLEVEVKPKVSDESRVVVGTVQTHEDKIQNRMTVRTNAVQAPNLIDVKVNLTKLKKVAWDLAKRIDIAPSSLALVSFLLALVVDVESLDPYFYTPSLNINEIDIREMGFDQDPYKRRKGNGIERDRKRKSDKKKKKKRIKEKEIGQTSKEMIPERGEIPPTKKVVETIGGGTYISLRLNTLSASAITGVNLSTSATATVDAIRVEQTIGDPLMSPRDQSLTSIQSPIGLSLTLV